MTHMPGLRECIGGVPLIVRLASQDIVHPSEKPAPIAFVLPRTTLLIAVLKDLLQMFAPYAVALNKFSTQVWFSFNNLPIPWIYPVGAVKDYITELRRLKALNSIVNTVRNHNEAQNDDDDDKYKDENTCVQMLFTFAAQPVELYFHIHPQSQNCVIERVVPAVIDYEHLDTFIRNEVRQWHKATYTALYGTYKYYHNLMEAVLLPVLAMALYRPFDTQESRPLLAFMKMNSTTPTSAPIASVTTTEHPQLQAQENKTKSGKNKWEIGSTSVQHGTSALPPPSQIATSESTTLPPLLTSSSSSLTVQETSQYQNNICYDKNTGVSTTLQPELTSPYLLTEYQHILQEKLNRPRVSFLLSIAIPIVEHNVNELDTIYEQHPLTFQLCRVSAAPMKRIEVEQKEQQNNANANNNNNNNLEKDSQSANREGYHEPISEARKQEEFSSNLEIDATPLGLLIWRAFRLPYFRWLRSRNNNYNTYLELEHTTPTIKIDSNDKERSNDDKINNNDSNNNDDNDCNNINAKANKEGDLLFAALSFCYKGASEDVMNADHEGLRTALPTEAVEWGSWEAQMVHRLINMYDTHGIYVPDKINSDTNSKVKNENNTIKSESKSSSAVRISDNTIQSHFHKRRMYFEVQGTQPPLCTPASFIESNFTSSDRSIYITVQVY